MKYRKGVFIICYRKEKNKIYYLLLKRKLHWRGWEFPKGGIEKSEPVLKAVKRETKEETGQFPKNINNYKCEGKYKYNKKINGREESGGSFILYSCEIKNKKVKIDKREHSNYAWKTFDQTLKMLTWPNQRKSLRIVNNYINNRTKKYQQSR